MTIIVVVALLSLVQSLFGVGLLLFGTPILLMLGLSFRDALWVLLPASLTVSTLQLVLDRRLDLATARSLIVWMVPSVVAGLLLILTMSLTLRIDYLVAAILVVSVMLRVSAPVRERLALLCHHYRRAMLLVIGFVHGLTNMGGSLLSVYAAAQSAGKYAIRQYIALGYAFFASTQLLVLVATHPGGAYPQPWLYMAIAAAVFVGLGRSAFGQLNQQHYSMLLNLFTLGCASMLIVKNLLLPTN
jgi:uncharacterized membrane protein YfcA